MSTPFPLGRNREHDPRSRNFAISPPSRTLFPVTHTLRAPHLNQADIGSCEGDTGAEFLNCAKAVGNRVAFWNKKNVKGRGYLTQRNALELYSLATTLDDDGIPGRYPPTDTGTSGVGIAKAMQTMGAIDSYGWTFTFNDFLTTLQKQPIMLGLNWYDSMFEYDSQGFVRMPPPRTDPVGGHAALAFAMRHPYSADFRVGCANHWVQDDGSPWGVRIGSYDGCFWFTGAFLEELLIHQQGESLVPVLK
jgi:hypothetical protein